MWGQIGSTITNVAHSVTYRRIRQTVSPPLDFPKMLTRDVLKIVFFDAGCDDIVLGHIKPRGCLQPDNCAQQSDVFALSHQFIKCLYLKLTIIRLISFSAEKLC